MKIKMIIEESKSHDDPWPPTTCNACGGKLTEIESDIKGYCCGIFRRKPLPPLPHSEPHILRLSTEQAFSLLNLDLTAQQSR